MSDNLPARRDDTAGELTVGDLIAQVTKIQEAMRAVMHDGEHFGTIPGTPKPTLLKPGAEKLCLLFRLNPEYEVLSQTEEPNFIAFTVRCTLYHIPTGNRVASGLGSCSSREEKYGWRKQARRCPKCGREAIIKGKAEYGGGWLCFDKKGGCKAKWPDGAAEIESQPEGKVPNENVWEQHNTLLKMASKRALVAAVLNGTAASDLFTQDLEDLPQMDGGGASPGAPAGGAQRQAPEGRKTAPAAPGASSGASTPAEGESRSKVAIEVVQLCRGYAQKVGITADEAVAEASLFIGNDGKRHQLKGLADLNNTQLVSLKRLYAMRRRLTEELIPGKGKGHGELAGYDGDGPDPHASESGAELDAAGFTKDSREED